VSNERDRLKMQLLRQTQDRGEENSKSPAPGLPASEMVQAHLIAAKELAFHESQQPEESEQRSEDKDGREVQAVAGNDRVAALERELAEQRQARKEAEANLLAAIEKPDQGGREVEAVAENGRFAALERELAELRQARDEAEANLVAAIEKADHLAVQLDEAKKRVTEYQAEAEIAEKKTSALAQSEDRLGAAVAEAAAARDEIVKKLEVAEEMAARCKTVISVQQERMLEQESKLEQCEESLKTVQSDAAVLRDHNTTLARAVKSTKEADAVLRERLQQAIERGLAIEKDKEEALQVASDAMDAGSRYRTRLAGTAQLALRHMIGYSRFESSVWAFGAWVTAREQRLADDLLQEPEAEAVSEESDEGTTGDKVMTFAHKPASRGVRRPPIVTHALPQALIEHTQGGSVQRSVLQDMGATPAGWRDAQSGMSYMTDESLATGAQPHNTWPVRADILASQKVNTFWETSKADHPHSSDSLLGGIGTGPLLKLPAIFARSANRASSSACGV